MIFHAVRLKNFLSYGNNITEFKLDDSQVSVITGENGKGKCLDKTTEIHVKFENDRTREKFLNFSLDFEK